MKAGVPCRAMSASSVVTGTRMVLVHAWPSQPGAPSAASRNASEAVDTVGLSTLSLSSSVPVAAADRDRLDRDRAIAAVKQLQRPDQRRLRLDRHHARAEPAKDGDTVADMGADVEHEIAGRSRTGYRADPWPRGARDRRNTGGASARRRERSARIRTRTAYQARQHEGYRAGAATARSRAVPARAIPAAARSLPASRSRPIAISARPSAGAAVTTASGIESSGPPAMQEGIGNSRRCGDARARDSGTSPIKVCGQNCRTASDHGTS